MKNLNEVASLIEAEGHLENCYILKCDKKAVAELVIQYADETIVAALKEIYFINFGEDDDELQAAIRCVLKHYMTPDEYAEWENQTRHSSYENSDQS